MKLPHFVLGGGSRLLPPTILFEDVWPAVAVHVADAHAVRETIVFPIGRDRVELPRLRRIVFRNFCVTKLTAGVEDKLRPAVARDVGEGGRFIVDCRECQMALPRLLLTLRIFEPIRFFAGKADDEDISPAVAVDVVREREEVFGVAVDIERLGV